MNRRERSVVRAGLALGVFLGLAGCQATVPPVPTETVGTLAAGPSVYSAPVHAVTPPPSLAFVPGSDDDDATSTATTVSRVDAGEADAIPEIESKNSHGF